MKKSLLNYICCPTCKKEFSLSIFKDKDGEVLEGALKCSCGKSFPIINSIPRVLPDNLMETVESRFPEFFSKHKEFFNGIRKGSVSFESVKKEKTSKSFGFEWEKFSDMRGEWEKNFNFYFEPADKNDFQNNIALELGCGNGRHTFYAAKLFKELISVDLSSAVDVAYLNNRQYKNTHFIQVDIYYLPFKDKFFDFVFCIGVLHHLPTPEEGFKKLVNLLNSGGGILIYVYHSFSKTMFKYYLLRAVNFFRRFTTKISHKLLYILSYPMAISSYLVLVLPYKFIFRRFIKSGWPLGAYADYSFFVMLNDTFDRFSAPIENRYSKEQILEWFNKAHLKDIKIMGGTGWRVFGKNIN